MSSRRLLKKPKRLALRRKYGAMVQAYGEDEERQKRIEDMLLELTGRAQLSIDHATNVI